MDANKLFQISKMILHVTGDLIIKSKKVSEYILLSSKSSFKQKNLQRTDVYSVCVYLTDPYFLFPTKSVSPCTLDFTHMQQFDHSIMHAAQTVLGSAHSAPGLASKLDR